MGAHRRRDAAPSHHEDRRQHARRLFPSAHSRLRGGGLVDHGVPPRPAVAGARRGPARRPAAPDDGGVLRVVPGRGDLDNRAVRAAGHRRAGHARPDRRVVAAAGRADAWGAVADGRRMARVAGVEGLPVPRSRLGRWCLARQPGDRGTRYRRAGPSAPERAGKAARAGAAGRRGRAACRLLPDAAGGDDGIRVLRAAANLARVLDARSARDRRARLAARGPACWHHGHAVAAGRSGAPDRRRLRARPLGRDGGPRRAATVVAATARGRLDAGDAMGRGPARQNAPAGRSRSRVALRCAAALCGTRRVPRRGEGHGDGHLRSRLGHPRDRTDQGAR